MGAINFPKNSFPSGIGIYHQLIKTKYWLDWLDESINQFVLLSIISRLYVITIKDICWLNGWLEGLFVQSVWQCMSITAEPYRAGWRGTCVWESKENESCRPEEMSIKLWQNMKNDRRTKFSLFFFLFRYLTQLRNPTKDYMYERHLHLHKTCMETIKWKLKLR